MRTIALALLSVSLPGCSAWSLLAASAPHHHQRSPTACSPRRHLVVKAAEGAEADDRIAKLEATLRGLEEDGYPAEVLAGLRKEIEALKTEIGAATPSTDDVVEPPPSADLVQPWTPDGDTPAPPPPSDLVQPWTPDGDVSPPPAPPPLPPPSVAPPPRIVSGMNKLRQQTEEGYVAPPPMPPRGLQPSFFDKLRARVNKWTPDEAAADVQQRAEAAQRVAEFEAAEKVRYAERLAAEQEQRKTVFAAEALGGAIGRARRALAANRDIFEWSGSTRRARIIDETALTVEEVATKLGVVVEHGGRAELVAEAEEVLADLRAAQAAFEG